MCELRSGRKTVDSKAPDEVLASTINPAPTQIKSNPGARGFLPFLSRVCGRLRWGNLLSSKDDVSRRKQRRAALLIGASLACGHLAGWAGWKLYSERLRP